MDFDNATRQGTGTGEWCESYKNIGTGCKNDCKYCYARYNSEIRWKKTPLGTWIEEKINWKAIAKPVKKVKGVVMFPTTHDITETYLKPAQVAILKLLAAGNKILIVTKPRLTVFMQLIEYLEKTDKYLNHLKIRENILFRISITGTEDTTSKFWEPGAPPPSERILCLQLAHTRGFQTSVSCEPILPGPISYPTMGMMIYQYCKQYITDTIWFGTLNDAKNRIPGATPDMLATISEFQSDDMVLRLVNELSPPQLHPKVRWKDTVKKIIEKDLHERNKNVSTFF